MRCDNHSPSSQNGSDRHEPCESVCLEQTSKMLESLTDMCDTKCLIDNYLNKCDGKGGELGWERNS
jgi:hypothetical protein